MSGAPPPAAAPAPGGCCGGCGKPEEVKGMAKRNQRKCRDVLCCLLFMVFWVGMIVIGAIGLKYGNWQRLVYGTDYKGNTCGTGSLSGQQYTVYPRVNEDFLLNLGKTDPLTWKFYGICVSSCPGTLSVVCNYEAPLLAQQAASPYTTANMLSCMYNSTYVANPTAGVTCASVTNNCWVVPLLTSSVLFRCVPVYNTTNAATTVCSYPPGVTNSNDPACVLVTANKFGSTQQPAKTNQLFTSLNTVQAIWGRWFGDLARAWWVILISSVAVATVLGFVWLIVAKWCTGVFVWGTIFLVLSLLGFITGYFYYKAGLIGGFIPIPSSIQNDINQFNADTTVAASAATYFVPQSLSADLSSTTAYQVMAGIATAVTLVVLMLVISLRRSIRTAVQVIKLGAEALQSMPSLICFPITTVLALALFSMWWVFVAASLATAGTSAVYNAATDAAANLATLSSQAGYSVNTTATFLNSPTLNNTFNFIQDIPSLQYLQIYNVFGLLWTTQFIIGMASISVAGAVGSWYFSRDGGGGGKAPASLYPKEAWPLWSSTVRAVCLYMGTVAFGSLLIAILQMIRLVVAYIYKRMKDNGQANSGWVKFICCCAQCCLYMMQKCIELISHNAYIYTAIKGTSFCESSASVFRIILQNAWTMAVVNVLCEIIMFLGKLAIAAACGWFAYAMLDNYPQFQAGGASQISSTWLVILVTVFFAYAVATAFMLVFDLCVDSVLICYCVDVTDNGGKALHMDAAKWGAVHESAKEEAQAGLTQKPPPVSIAPSAPPHAGQVYNSVVVGGGGPGSYA